MLTLENLSSNISVKGGVGMKEYTLKELRARKNMTQSEVAFELGISTQTYNSWEADFGKVKLREANKVAKFFGVKLDQIKQ